MVKSEEAAPDKSPEMQHRDSADSVITPYLASDEPASVASDLSTASNLSTSPRLSNTATTAVDGGLVPVGDRCLMDTNAIARVLGLNTPPQWVTTVKMQLVQAYTQLQLAYQQQLQMKPQHELHVFKQKQVQQSQHAFGQKYVQIATKMHALQQKHPKAWQQLLAQHQQGQPNPQLQQALLAGYKHASQQAGAQQVQVQMPLPLQMQMQMQLPQGASSSLKTPLGGPVFRRGRAHAGGVHMTMQQKESTLPVQALVHAFHCADPACQQKTCADTKQVLKRMEVHVQQCPTRRAQRQSAQQGGPPPQLAECKVCKLWQSLHRTKSSSGQQQSVQQQQKQALQCQQNKHAAAQPVQENPVTVDARYWQVQAWLVIEYGDMVSQLYERFVQQDAAGGSRQKNLAFMAPIMQIFSEGCEAATALKTQFNVEEIRKAFEVLKKITLRMEQSREAAANATAAPLAAALAGGSCPVEPAPLAVAPSAAPELGMSQDWRRARGATGLRFEVHRPATRQMIKESLEKLVALGAFAQATPNHMATQFEAIQWRDATSRCDYTERITKKLEVAQQLAVKQWQQNAQLQQASPMPVENALKRRRDTTRPEAQAEQAWVAVKQTRLLSESKSVTEWDSKYADVSIGKTTTWGERDEKLRETAVDLTGN